MKINKLSLLYSISGSYTETEVQIRESYRRDRPHWQNWENIEDGTSYYCGQSREILTQNGTSGTGVSAWGKVKEGGKLDLDIIETKGKNIGVVNMIR